MSYSPIRQFFQTQCLIRFFQPYWFYLVQKPCVCPPWSRCPPLTWLFLQLLDYILHSLASIHNLSLFFLSCQKSNVYMQRFWGFVCFTIGPAHQQKNRENLHKGVAQISRTPQGSRAGPPASTWHAYCPRVGPGGGRGGRLAFRTWGGAAPESTDQTWTRSKDAGITTQADHVLRILIAFCPISSSAPP